MVYQSIKTWKNVKCILLNKRSQSERLHTYFMILTIRHSEKGKTREKNDQWLPEVKEER